MLKYEQFFIIILVALVLSCKEDDIPEPVADFVVQEPRETLNYILFDLADEIQFENLSTNATKFLWDFGDGTTSEFRDPKHTYDSAGTYNVTLTSYNIEDKYSEATIKLKVAPRIMTGLFISSLPENAPKRMFVFLGETENPTNTYLIGLPYPYSSSSLPLGGTILLEEAFTNTNWFIMIIKDNIPISVFDENDELVGGTVFYPSRSANSVTEGIDGKIRLNEFKDNSGVISDEFSMIITYTLKKF